MSSVAGTSSRTPETVTNNFSFASYEHVTSLTLSLPLSPALTFLTILLPVFAAGNALALPTLIRSSHTNRQPFLLKLLLLHPVALQVLQGIATTILATLYFTDMVPSDTRSCELTTGWQRLFRTKNSHAIRAIQEAFQCCGFRSVKDMAWPFPPVDVGCAARFDRSLACRGPWTQALQSSAGVQFGVVLAVGLLQARNHLSSRRHSLLLWPC